MWRPDARCCSARLEYADYERYRFPAADENAAGGGQDPVVVFCTTENDEAHIREAITAGANECIMKPFDGVVVESKFSQTGLI